MKVEKKPEWEQVYRFCFGDMLLRTAARYPNKEAIAYSYQGKVIERLTYSQFNKRVNRCAHALMERGIKKGDVIGVYSHNTVQFLIIVYACAKMGACVAPVNFTLKGQAIVDIMNIVSPVMFIAEDDLVDPILEVQKDLPSVKEWFIANVTKQKPAPQGWLDFDDELCSEKYSEEEPQVNISGDDYLILLFTSGTETLPKCAPNTHANWYSSVLSGVVDHHWRPNDTLLVAVPLYHLGAQYISGAQFAIGARIVLQHLPDPREQLQLFESEKINSFFSVPAMAFNWIHLPIPDHEKQKALRSLEKAVLFGNILPESMTRQLMLLTPQCYWQLGYYGQTETSALGCNLSQPDILRKYRESAERWEGAEPIGMTHQAVEMKIFDENDNEVAPGVVGEIVQRGPSMFPGYLGLEEKNREAFRNRWWHSGDLGLRDEEGYFYFVDRMKDAIKSGGENISTMEVEAGVFANPKVEDCAVAGLPHPRWGEACTAFVVPKPGESLTEEEVLETCKNKLAAFKVPKKVIFVDRIPKNPSGKTLKRNLRAEHKGVFEY